MKLVKIMQVVFLGAAMFLLTACGETGTSGQSTSENTASAGFRRLCAQSDGQAYVGRYKR